MVGGPTGGTTANGADGKTRHTLLVEKKEIIGPEMFMLKEICADFRDSLLVRIDYKDTIFFSTLPPKQADRKETKFSFRVEGSSKIRRVALISYCVSNLRSGISCENSIEGRTYPIMKFSLQPKLTLLPLKVHLVKRHVGTLLPMMI